MTGRIGSTLRFAERLAAIGKPVWVRFTLVPGFTDDPANVEGSPASAPMKNVEWVEVQPFHQLGAFAEGDGFDYKHSNTPTPTPDLINRVIELTAPRAAARADLVLKSTTLFAGAIAMLELAQNIIATQPILAVFSPSASAIWSARSISADSARRRCRLVRRACHRRVCAEGVDHRPIGLTGLIMFLYGTGSSTSQFFEGMTGAAGLATCLRWSGSSPAPRRWRSARRSASRSVIRLAFRRLDDQHRQLLRPPPTS